MRWTRLIVLSCTIQVSEICLLSLPFPWEERREADGRIEKGRMICHVTRDELWWDIRLIFSSLRTSQHALLRLKWVKLVTVPILARLIVSGRRLQLSSPPSIYSYRWTKHLCIRLGRMCNKHWNQTSLRIYDAQANNGVLKHLVDGAPTYRTSWLWRGIREAGGHRRTRGFSFTACERCSY